MNAEIAMSKDWAATTSTGRLPLQIPSSGRLVSYSMPAPGLSVASFLQQAEGQPRFFWQAGEDETIYAGFGTAVQLMAWGEKRFSEIQQKATALFETGQVLGLDMPPTLPRLFGGFSFRDEFTPENAWAAFHPAHFVLPHFQLVQTGSASWLTINALVPDEEAPNATRQQLQEALEARYRHLATTAKAKTVPTSGAIPEVRFPMSYDNWTAQINRALGVMQDSALKKVVLARVCEIRSKNHFDVMGALAYLNESFQKCTRFLFEPRPYHAFFGATPELLVKAAGNQVYTMAMAGSTARGETVDEDRMLEQKLLASTKDRHEHQLVVAAIQRRMEPLSTELSIPTGPDIFRLSYIHHLYTPISGSLRERSGVLPLVELLHPTPALGGSPRELAVQFIGEAEPVPRGWYAGPVGWFDSQMDGEFVVAIRSAVAQERRVWAYAGAGIVPESRPDKEWAETNLKFRPILRALGVDESAITTVASLIEGT